MTATGEITDINGVKARDQADWPALLIKGDFFVVRAQDAQEKKETQPTVGEWKPEIQIKEEVCTSADGKSKVYLASGTTYLLLDRTRMAAIAEPEKGSSAFAGDAAVMSKRSGYQMKLSQQVGDAVIGGLDVDAEFQY